MSKVKIVSSIVLVLVIVGVCIGSVLYFATDKPDEMVTNGNSLKLPKDTIRLWYTDEAMTDYINRVAIEYHEENDIRVIPTLKSGLEYIEAIYDASIDQAEYPDLYIVSNDSLEKAYLTGVADNLSKMPEVVDLSNFPQVATNAATYHDKLVAYPLYFETSVFLYNKTYLDDFAENLLLRNELETEFVEEPEDEVIEVKESEFSEEEIEQKADEIFPNTFVQILELANKYEAPQEVEAFIRWDVSDVFYNYFFVGNSINVGGECGDNIDEIEIYNNETLVSLKMYQDLHEFFYIEADEVSYDSVVDDFINGKIVFAIATTDVIDTIEKAGSDGKFNYEYKVAAIPDVNDNIMSRGLSVTNSIAINSYSEHKELANEFAKYIIEQQGESLYEETGKLPVYNKVDLKDDNLKVAKLEYEKSISTPKLLALSNYWLLLENCMTKVWALEDAEEELYNLATQIMTQVTGDEIKIERINVKEVSIDDELEEAESGD